MTKPECSSTKYFHTDGEVGAAQPQRLIRWQNFGLKRVSLFILSNNLKLDQSMLIVRRCERDDGRLDAPFIDVFNLYSVTKLATESYRMSCFSFYFPFKANIY